MNLAACRCVFQVYLYLSVDVGPIRLSCIPAMNVLRRGMLFFYRFLGSALSFFLRKPSVELAFLVILLIWGLHLRSSEIVTPKYGFSGTCCSMCLSSS